MESASHSLFLYEFEHEFRESIRFGFFIFTHVLVCRDRCNCNLLQNASDFLSALKSQWLLSINDIKVLPSIVLLQFNRLHTSTHRYNCCQMKSKKMRFQFYLIFISVQIHSINVYSIQSYKLKQFELISKAIGVDPRLFIIIIIRLFAK